MRHLIVAFALVVFGSLVGCGGESNPTPLDFGGPDATAIAVVIEEMNEAIGSVKKLDQLVIKKPTDMKKLTKYSYSIVGKPTVSGTTATATVRLEEMKNSANSVEQNWEFEKVGDKWKVKTLVLP